MSQDTHYDHEIVKHDPQEGFDPTEPHASRITFFVIISLITLVVVVWALQNYFVSVWDSHVADRVTNVAPPDLEAQHALENWRMTHYEFTTPEKQGVRIPLEVAKALVLSDAKQGKTFYPAKATAPVPETPADNEAEKKEEVAKK